MGCNQSSTVTQKYLTQPIKKHSFLQVNTLNYCGVFTSPFQYYSGTFKSQLQQLNKIFYSLIPRYVTNYKKQQFQWNISSIDKKINKNRYCPLYNMTVGIQNKKFLTRKKFIQIWEKTFENNAKIINLSYTNQIKNKIKQFDLLAFHTLLFYVYKVNTIDEAQTLNPQRYLDTYRPFFDQTFLDETRKISDLILTLSTSDFDILFLQKVTQNLINAIAFSMLHKFFLAISNDRDTLILARKGPFSKLKSSSQTLHKLTDIEINSLIWNGHTCIMIVDNYILLSGHLSAKKYLTPENIQMEKSSLMMLKKKFPNYNIICGCDANGFVSHFSNHFNIFPKRQDQITTRKKRTHLQTKYKKGQVIVMQAKDHIISNLRILEGYIVTIDGHNIEDKVFLPLNEHPYDHFLVGAKLEKTIM